MIILNVDFLLYNLQFELLRILIPSSFSDIDQGNPRLNSFFFNTQRARF